MPIVDLGRVVGKDGAPGKDGMSARNLLDNSDFRSPVNQRGASGKISTAGYFLDRWKLVDGSATIGNDGITLDGTIAQIIEKTPTGSVTPCANAGKAEFDANTNTFSLSGTGVVVTWAALYECEYAAETLPTYVPKGYLAELAACQRYFVRIGGNVYTHIGLASAQNGTQLILSVTVPQAMREDVTPTLAKGGAGNMTAKSGTVFRNISAIAVNQRGVSVHALTLTTSNATPGYTYDVYVPIGSWLDISADL